ncbi:MAG: hypothetical protein IJU41_07760 [Clostridia bacterium]|nr:hypothetical protein [Clostridia bacterium]
MDKEIRAELMETMSETEVRVLQKMEARNFPDSVITTVVIAIQESKRAKEAAEEMEALLDKQATPREMVKAIQPIIRENENLDTK